MKLALIPIDNRPVCYDLPESIANIDGDLELFLPDKKFLGGLYSSANTDGILNWLDWLEKTGKNVDAIVVSLDTIAHGGLIASRRSKDSFEEIKSRLEKFKEKFVGKKVYAFSSIMRISHNNVNEEEKEYWDEYGEKIFEYSYKLHKEFTELNEVPKEIIDDYLATRYRNFRVNKMYLDWFSEGLFDTLVYSKDDCAEFGLNVFESELLQKFIKEKNISSQQGAVFIKTGADEIPLTLFARAVSDYNKVIPRISPKFLVPQYKDLISNYEDISIEKSVEAQILLAGGKLTNENDSDIVLLVNNFEEFQGEIVMGVKTEGFVGPLSLPEKPFLVADVRFANGADNRFVEKFFKNPLDFKNFYGYSAWNTSANTLGSLICTGIVRLFAKNYNEEAFKKLQLVRFLDDWAYQANVRQILKKEGERVKKIENRPDVRRLKKFMEAFEKKLFKILGIKPKVKYFFPWKRFFEIGVIVK